MLDRAARQRTGDHAEDRVLMTAALCHRMQGAPEAGLGGRLAVVGSFLERLTNERVFVEAVQGLLAELETPQRLYERREAARPGEIRRLALRQRIPFLLRAARAHHEARWGDAPFPAQDWLETQARALGVWERPPEPILKGRHLLERGVRPGPDVGAWVRAAFERQLDGEIASLEDALRWLEEQGAPGPQGPPGQAVGGGPP
jgi:tRNA nucleotidyltransferase (CCA-adding enzyme)